MTAEGARDFTLADELAETNVVILFFPGAFTHVCQAQMCKMTDEISRYKDLDAKVIGISVDTYYAQDAWAKQEKITIPLLSDLQKEVTRAYDVVWPDFGGMGPASARAAFVVDRRGVVAYSEHCPSLLDQPDYDAITACLSSLPS
jgi:peroxiredoxin